MPPTEPAVEEDEHGRLRTTSAPAEPAVEGHQVTEVENNLKALGEVADQVRASMSVEVDCCLVSDDAPVPEGDSIKKINFIRHGEGHHNVAQREWRAASDWDGKSEPYTLDTDPDFKFGDAELTETGTKQAEALHPRTATFTPEILVVSPMRRATQTGLIAFTTHVEKGLKVIACELCHEMGGKHTCDKRLPRSQLMVQFPAVDFSILESEEDPFWNDGLSRETWHLLAERAARFAEWLANRPEKHIAVAAHSAFLLTIFNAVLKTDTEEASKWFGTGEMRTVMLTFKNKT